MKKIKELNSETHKIIKSYNFNKNKNWKLGGAYIEPYWRVVIFFDDLEFNIALPGLYKTDKDAIKQATKIGMQIDK